MGYTDSHGRPEIVMHPDIKRGRATFRIERQPDNPEQDGTPRDDPGDRVQAADPSRPT